MRIGFDISQTGPTKAGCGWFADSLIQHLAKLDSKNEYVLYPTFGDAYWDAAGPKTIPIIKQPNFRCGLSHSCHAKTQQFWRNPPADLEAQLGTPDVVHSNNFFCPTNLAKARLVYTLYDLCFLEHPETTSEANRLVCFNGVLQAGLHADLIIAISQYTRNHFMQIFPHYPADRIAVVHPASRLTLQENIRPSGKLSRLQPDQFWLTVGTLEPRKNHRRLLHAYARQKTQTGKTFPLVLAGSRGWLMKDFDRLIQELRLHEDIILLGYVAENDLQWLYQNCFAFLYPSLFEGFGLPVLEAMTLGAPVIVSNCSSLPEIAGSAGLLVDPLQVEAIAYAMHNLTSGTVKRSTLRQQALMQARKFSWQTTAQQIHDLYRKVIQLPPRHRIR
ncbi:MAG: glycosyltransferase family 1 protein [Verrucomicrobiota bacterium]